jgi:hypothetical protein
VRSLNGDELEPGMVVAQKTEVGDDLIASNEQILASVAVSRGRVFLVSTKHIYAIGKRRNPALPAVPMKAEVAPAGAKVGTCPSDPSRSGDQPGECRRLEGPPSSMPRAGSFASSLVPSWLRDSD